MIDTNNEKIIEANKLLHSKLAFDYNKSEPHFSSENIIAVKKRLTEYCGLKKGNKALDLGCGTGFMINILKNYFDNITGIDVTQNMLDQVDRESRCKINLINCDTGTVDLPKCSYDLVTAYSFLHHLYDIKPTIETAYKALRNDGCFYADLDPNFYFWEKIISLSKDSTIEYDPIVTREINAVLHNDKKISEKYIVPETIFNQAEYGKNIKGGFIDFEIVDLLKSVGFKKIKVFYTWYIGQGSIINRDITQKSNLLTLSSEVDNILQKALPLSKPLFKYFGFCATK